MKLDIHVTFSPGVHDVDLSSRNAQINTVEHDHAFDQHSGDIAGLHINISVDQARTGRQKSLLTVRTDRCGFTFAPIDLTRVGTIHLPAYGVSIMQRGAVVSLSHGLSKLQLVEHIPEDTFEQAAACTQDVPCPTLLGLGLDNRQFLVEPDLETIRVVNSVRYQLASIRIPIGRGKGSRTDVRRRLDDGVMPILRGEKTDEDICYSVTTFVALAGTELNEGNVAGTPFLVAEEGLGMPHTPEQAAQREQARQEMATRGLTPLVLCYRLEATNVSRAPAYAFLYQPRFTSASGEGELLSCSDGLLVIGDKVYGSAYFDDQPWPETQLVVLLAPGEKVTADYCFNHEPLETTSARRLLKRSNGAGESTPGQEQPVVTAWQPFDKLLAQARAYWTAKLNTAATMDIPEQRINDMVRAGLAHLYLVTYGERDRTLAPCIGVYSPIGSESSPIIQFYDSIGWHDIAQRSLQYFLDKQHGDGRFQNFGGYMLETGAALYTMGEHYRYTRDDAWVRGIKGQLVRACDWIIRHHHEDAPKGQHGAGLIMGKVADPEDHFRQYMLNAYQYLGLARAAEMLRAVDTPLAASLAEEASTLRTDIRRALAESIVRSPLVPLGDGRWVPSCAPWVEAVGPDAFALDGQLSYTHEAVYARDSLLGPIYAIFAEVIDPHEQIADFLVESHYEHMCYEGAAFSQPYYSRHPLVHLRRGEISAFLRSFYRAMAALADRETYTFWEHLFGVSPHKTHEEGWFLMEARSMLYTETDFSLEGGGTLRLLPGIPRAYLAQDQHIGLQDAQSYFGTVHMDVQSHIDRDYIEANVECPQGLARGLKSIAIRLPHPHGQKAEALAGPGRYDPATETVWVEWSSENRAQIHLRF